MTFYRVNGPRDIQVDGFSNWKMSSEELSKTMIEFLRGFHYHRYHLVNYVFKNVFPVEIAKCTVTYFLLKLVSVR